MNPLASVYHNPLIPEGQYWLRLTAVDYLPPRGDDVDTGFVATLVVESPHPDLHGTELSMVVYGTGKATNRRQCFRDHFRCFDYPPQFTIGRWARAQIVPAEYDGQKYSQVLFPELSAIELNRMRREAVGLERQSGTTTPPRWNAMTEKHYQNRRIRRTRRSVGYSMYRGSNDERP